MIDRVVLSVILMSGYVGLGSVWVFGGVELSEMSIMSFADREDCGYEFVVSVGTC